MRLTDESREKLAKRVCALIEMGQAEKSSLETRWKANKGYYDNVPIPCVSKIVEGAEDYPYPLLSSRLNALRDMVVGTVCSQKPYLLAGIRGSNQRLEDVENALQFFLEMGKLQDALLEMAPIIGYTNTGILRAQFTSNVQDYLPGTVERVQSAKSGPFTFVGLTFDVIHPDDFICVGSNIFGLNTAQAVGHRYWLQRQQIKEGVKAKRFLECTLMSGTPDANSRDRDVQNSVSSYSGDDKIELWDVIFRCSLKDYDANQDDPAKDYERYYLATVAFDSREILTIEEYKFSRPWYTAFRYMPKPHDGFWSGASVAQDLQGMHVQYNCLQNLVAYAAMYDLFPVAYEKGAPAQKYSASLPGVRVGIEGAEVFWNPNRMNFEGLYAAIAQIERNADSVSRLNSAGMGQEYSKDMTATEASQLAAGQQAGITGFIRIFGGGLSELADLCCELLHTAYDIWYPLYGETLFEGRPLVQDTLVEPIQWDVNGASPQQTPQQTAAKMQALLELSNAEQQAGVQDLLANLPTLLLQAGMTPEIIQVVVQAVMQSPSSPMLDRREIIRTFVNNLGINNADKVLMDDDTEAKDGQPGMGAAAGALAAQSGMPAKATGDPVSEPGY